jgi:thiamine-phosphate pyrophosphorylase
MRWRMPARLRAMSPGPAAAEREFCMDRKLVAWARAVKARHRWRGGKPALPPLWLFTDADRLPDPCPAIARLPAGLAGVVLRPDGTWAARRSLGLQVARLCRARRLHLVVAGDARLAALLRAGIHLRGGNRRGALADGCGVARRCGLPVTSSAHSRTELVRARRAGADAVFLSPVFPTRSHPGAPALGTVRWAALARNAGLPALALGGVSEQTARRLPPVCQGAGAIGALR